MLTDNYIGGLLPPTGCPRRKGALRNDGYYRAGIRCVNLLLERGLSSTPIILYTILERIDLAEELESLPANVRYLTKRSNPWELKDVISQML